VILAASALIPGYILVGNKDYPQIADDYVHGFQVLRSLPVDVFLGAHGRFFDIAGQVREASSRRSLRIRFIDPAATRHTSICRKTTSAPNWRSSSRREVIRPRPSADYDPGTDRNAIAAGSTR